MLRSHPAAHPSLALACLSLLLFVCTNSRAATLDDLALEPVFEDLENPVWVTADPQGALVVTLLPGIVLRADGSTLDPTPVLDLQDRVRGGGGLHSVVFHPTRPWLFAHFSEATSGDLVVSRFELAGTPARADRGSEAELLRQSKVIPLHYGGQLAFGPIGMLWISTGDGTLPGSPDPQCSAQDTTSLEGKILRLDVDRDFEQAPYYAVPHDNPFAAGGGAAEIWGLGLRNPWRFSFDREEDALWISDVGEDTREEVSLVSSTDAGVNFGWKRMEGTRCFPTQTGCGELPPCGDPAYEPPRVEYSNAGGRCAVVGGFVYRGRLVPALFGRYVYGDFCSGELWSTDTSGASEALVVALPGLNSFGEDADGELYLTSGSTVHRLVDGSLPEGGLVELATTDLSVSESEGTALVEVVRVGGAAGSVEVTLQLSSGSATAGADFLAAPSTLTWQDGEKGTRIAQIPLVDDEVIEPSESFALQLDLVTGDTVIGVRSNGSVTIVNDDVCTPTATRLCLDGNRFAAEVSWRDAQDQEGAGNATSLGPDSGSFWFFSDNNPEIFLKVLDACQVPGFANYWVFAAGLTDVQTTLRVVDSTTGEERVYNRLLGESYEAVRDTAAFSNCP